MGADIFRVYAVGLSFSSVGALFRSAAAAGVNAVRLFGWLPGSPLFQCALDCATAHSTYLLHTIDGHLTDWADGDALAAHAAAVAAAVANETVVAGVDFVNEPYTADIAVLRVSAGSATTFGQAYNVSMDEYKRYEAALAPGAFSTYPALVSGLPPIPGFEAFAASLDAMWGAYLSLYATAAAASAPLTLTCVGTNHWEGLLPSVRRSTAFACAHAYADSGLGYGNATAAAWVPTLLDRLRAGAAASQRPVLLGETGSSNGEALHGALGGGLLDVHAAAVFDALPHLLSLAYGHSGALRWAVADVPLVYAVQGMPWLGNHSDPATTAKYAQQGGFGLTMYDGSADGAPKPTAVALRAVRGLLDELRDAGLLVAPWRGFGALAVGPAPADAANALRWGFAYTAPGALFVGAATHDDGAALAFNASACAVVAVRWGVAAAARRSLCVTSSADARAAVNAAAFAPGAPPAAGTSGGWTTLDLPQGVEVCV